jgi:predicted nucleotidyltransferase
MVAEKMVPEDKKVEENKIEQNRIEQNKIGEFVSRLRDAAGPNLQSVILFGSAVAGDFHPEFSDINLFCVIRDSSYAALQTLAPAVKWWGMQQQPAPLFMTQHELDRSGDIFTIELLDIKQHHHLLFGEDVLKTLSIPANLHRVQVEYELEEKLTLLRRNLLLASGNEPQLWDLLLRSVSSFATLFRHALIVLGQDAPPGKRNSVQALSKHIKFDASGILHVLDVREKRSERKQFDVTDVFSRYLAALEHVADAVDKMLASNSQRLS